MNECSAQHHQQRRSSVGMTSNNDATAAAGSPASARETRSNPHNTAFQRTGSLECIAPKLLGKTIKYRVKAGRTASNSSQNSSRADANRLSPGRIVFVAALVACAVTMVLAAAAVHHLPSKSTFVLTSFSSAHHTTGHESRKLPVAPSSAGDLTIPTAMENQTVTTHHSEEETVTITLQGQKVKVPYPIIVLNLPKAGTTALWQYFECGLGADQAVHWWTPNNMDPSATYGEKFIGPCLHDNIQQGRPPLEGCGDYKVWLDAGYASETQCFQPAVQGLEAIYKHYPTATLLWVNRDTEAWSDSIHRWRGLVHKWSRSLNCRKGFFPNTLDRFPRELEKKDYVDFYEQTREGVREFARMHPSMTYLEPPPEIPDLSSPSLGSWLEEKVGIDAKCWRKCRPKGQDAICDEEQEREHESSGSKPK